MDDKRLCWSRDEFLAYLLIYAAQVNQLETKEEKDFIHSKFNSSILKKIYQEINKDNDYHRIQKIMVYTYQNKYQIADLEKLLSEVKELLVCDGQFDSVEQSLYYYLKKIFFL